MADKDPLEKYRNLHQELINSCKKGNREAQFRIYELYYRAMFNTAMRITADPDDAEDVMQESFLKAFQKLNTYRGNVSFGAWLKKIVINKSLDFIKLKKTTVSLEEAGDQAELAEDQEEETILSYESDRIRKAIYRLPESYRIILSLFLLEGYDHDEISGILEISNSSSRTQYHRAKKRLVEELKQMNTEK